MLDYTILFIGQYLMNTAALSLFLIIIFYPTNKLFKIIWDDYVVKVCISLSAFSSIFITMKDLAR